MTRPNTTWNAQKRSEQFYISKMQVLRKLFNVSGPRITHYFKMSAFQLTHEVWELSELKLMICGCFHSHLN